MRDSLGKDIEPYVLDQNMLSWGIKKKTNIMTYQIIVADAADAVSVNFSGRCKFLQI